MKNFQTLWRLYGAYRYHILALAVLGFIGAILDGVAINIAVPSLSFLSNPHVVPTDVISKIIIALFSFLGISFNFRHLIIFITSLLLLRAMVLVVFGYIRGFITADFLAKESKVVLTATFLASWPFLLAQKIGHVQNTLERDLQRSSNLLEVLSQFIQSSTGFLMYLVVALNISPTMTLFTLGGGIVLALFIRPLLKRTQKAGAELASTDKEVSQFVTEHVIGMKSVKAAGREEAALRAGSSIFDRLQTLYVRIAFIRSLSSSFFQPFAMIFVIILFTLTYHSGSFDLIAFAATLYLIQKIFTYLESGQASLHGLRELIPYAEHVDEFKQKLRTARASIPAGTAPFAFKKQLSFNSVSFSYDGVRPVLENVSFSISKGTTVAVIGPSGAGKTSIADLTLRLFEPTKGAICLDGVPLSEIEATELRSQIGYVAQEAFLLNASISDNIRFYRPELTADHIAHAVKQANLEDVVSALPEGLDTIVGDRGVTLSGGQRQRIALARALAGSPALLILDEATSALDRESERLVQESIEALHGTVTVLVIAHRLSTIERADRILVLDKGSIIEEGSPKELAADSGSYYSRHRNSG